MNKEKRISELKEEKYQVIFGISKSTLEAMLAIVESAYKEMRKKGGRKGKLSVLDMLIITLGYYHDYRTMENIAFEYEVHKQLLSEVNANIENALIKDGRIALPSKREMLKTASEIVIAVVDVKEQERERSKKTEKNHTQASKNVTQQRI